MLHPDARAQLRDPSVLTRFVLSLALLLFTLNRISRFLDQIELRPGVVLADPLLAVITPRDLTWLSFGLIYGALVVAIFHLFRHPERLILGMQGYSIMMLFRATAMYLLPLDPPTGIIVLKDPFVEFFGNSGQPLTRDLFFSGHTSTMFLLYLASAPHSWVKKVFLFATLSIGACVLVQHVHYSVDVWAAPFFAYGAMRLAGYLNVVIRRLSEATRSR